MRTSLRAHCSHDRLALANIEIVAIELAHTRHTEPVALLLADERRLDLHAEIRIRRHVLVAAVALLDDDGALHLELLEGAERVLDAVRALVLKVLPVAVRVLDARHHVVVVVDAQVLERKELHQATSRPSVSSTTTTKRERERERERERKIAHIPTREHE